jgi:hypothetical protein
LNSIETLEFLVGIDNAQLKFQAIFDSICSLLTADDTPHLVRTISFKYLLALATVSVIKNKIKLILKFNFFFLQFLKQLENVNDNLFMEHFMLNNILFEAIIHVNLIVMNKKKEV